MLPLSILKRAQGHPTLVELKNGETYNGYLVSCDKWMNIHLQAVTRKHGDGLWRMPECYIRGNSIACLRFPDEVIEKVEEDTHKRSAVVVGVGEKNWEDEVVAEVDVVVATKKRIKIKTGAGVRGASRGGRSGAGGRGSYGRGQSNVTARS